jgi:hypothetical protein
METDECEAYRLWAQPNKITPIKIELMISFQSHKHRRRIASNSKREQRVVLVTTPLRRLFDFSARGHVFIFFKHLKFVKHTFTRVDLSRSAIAGDAYTAAAVYVMCVIFKSAGRGSCVISKNITEKELLPSCRGGTFFPRRRVQRALKCGGLHIEQATLRLRMQIAVPPPDRHAAD